MMRENLRKVWKVERGRAGRLRTRWMAASCHAGIGSNREILWLTVAFSVFSSSSPPCPHQRCPVCPAPGCGGHLRERLRPAVCVCSSAGAPRACAANQRGSKGAGRVPAVRRLHRPTATARASWARAGPLPVASRLFCAHNNLSFITPGAQAGLPRLAERWSLAHNGDLRQFARIFARSGRLRRLDLEGVCRFGAARAPLLAELPALRELPSPSATTCSAVPGALARPATPDACGTWSAAIEAVGLQLAAGPRRPPAGTACAPRYGGAAFPRLQRPGTPAAQRQPAGRAAGRRLLGLRRSRDRAQPGRHALGRVRLRGLQARPSWLSFRAIYLDRNRIAFVEEGAFQNLRASWLLHLNGTTTGLLGPPSSPVSSWAASSFPSFRNPWRVRLPPGVAAGLDGELSGAPPTCPAPPRAPWLYLGLLRQVAFGRPLKASVDPDELNLTASSPSPSPEPAATTVSRFSSLSPSCWPRGPRWRRWPIPPRRDRSTPRCSIAFSSG